MFVGRGVPVVLGASGGGGRREGGDVQLGRGCLGSEVLIGFQNVFSSFSVFSAPAYCRHTLAKCTPW